MTKTRRRVRHICLSAFGAMGLALAAPVCAQDNVISYDGQSYFDMVGKRGEMLYRHDQAAWHGTDVMLASMPEDFDRSSLRGYVVTPHADTERLNIAFHTGERVVWEAAVRGVRVEDATWLPEPRPLAEAEAARVRAIETAIPAVEDTCEGRTPMNTAVLQAETPDAFYVYFLSPMRTMDEAVFGKHYRAKVSADGRTLTQARSLTATCLVVGTHPEARGKPVGIMVSHHRDPLPHEIHAFVSLQHAEPVFVIIPGSAKGRADGGGDIIVRVDGAKMQLVEVR